MNRVLTDTNELGNSRSFVYDALGNLTERTDRNGKVREFDYDLLSRLTEERWVDGATVVNTLDYNYDAASQLLDAGDNNSSYAFTYDQLGRRTSTDNLGTPGVPNVVLSSAYDALGNRTSLTAAIDGNADFENTYAYDALSRMTSVEQSGVGILPATDKRVDFSYNALGQFTGIDRYEDLTATDLVASSSYTYDTAGRLTNLDHEDAASSTLAFYAWTYDSANRLTQVSSIDGTTDYTYDDTGQLIGAANSFTTDETYSYDENGNRTMAGYVIGANNLVLSDGTYNYQYDAENNLTKKTEIATGDYIQYAWDIGGRLTSVEYRDSSEVLAKRVEYTYDVFNRKIGKQVDDNGDGTFDRGERYVYDDSGKFDTATGVPLDDIVLVFDDSGSLTNRYLHGPAIDQVLADEQLTGSIIDEVLWGLSDHLGTVRDWAAYDAALAETTVSNHLTFDAFGNINSQTDPNATPLYAYTGPEWDADAELYYYRARWYDPALGRFISDDPSGFDAGDPNLQRYVTNNATNATDPSGLELTSDQKAVLGLPGNDVIVKQSLLELFEILEKNPTLSYKPWPFGTGDRCVKWVSKTMDAIHSAKKEGKLDKLRINSQTWNYVGDFKLWTIHCTISVTLPNGKEFYLDNAAYGGSDDHIILEFPSSVLLNDADYRKYKKQHQQLHGGPHYGRRDAGIGGGVDRRAGGPRPMRVYAGNK